MQILIWNGFILWTLSGTLLATSSWAAVKIWDFLEARCTTTFTDHTQVPTFTQSNIFHEGKVQRRFQCEPLEYWCSMICYFSCSDSLNIFFIIKAKWSLTEHPLTDRSALYRIPLELVKNRKLHDEMLFFWVCFWFFQDSTNFKTCLLAAVNFCHWRFRWIFHPSF